ncbi:MAG TPA: PAS domain S-box protein [Gemmatimonadales bacterium]|nr:PAS domain S-box protein [Gemmatimonadales bacterium]
MRDGRAGSTILVVDDNEANRYAVARLLRGEGYRVWEAATGTEALRLAHERPDLVVLDVRLPDVDGFEVCRRLKADAATASTPVVHLSASYTATEDRIVGLEGGADAYLTHPVEPRELSATVAALLRVRAAEARLRTALREWRGTFDAVADPICLVDPAGRITRCNRAFSAMLGRPFAALIGQPLAPLLPGVPVPPGERLSALGEVPDELPELRHGDRSYRPAVRALLDDRGVGVGAVYSFTDLTAHRRAEGERERLIRELEDARGRLAAVIKQMPAGLIIAAAPSGEIIMANEYAERFVGRPIRSVDDLDAYCRQRGFNSDGPPYAPGERPLARAVRRGELVRGEEIACRRADGEERFVVANAAPVRDANGAVVAGVVLFQDVTAQHRVERALRESEALYRGLAESMPQIVFTTTPDGRTDYVNSAFTHYTGLERSSAAGDGWVALLHPDDVEATTARWAATLAAGEPAEFEFRYRRRDGSHRWHVARVVPVRSPEGAIIKWVGTASDIHERKEFERFLREQSVGLEQRVAERTAELQESYDQLEAFSYSVSHDLRAPIRAIQGFTEAILDESGARLTAESLEYADRIVAATRRMDSLIRDLLAFSRVSRLQLSLEPLSLRSVVDEALSHSALEREEREATVDADIPPSVGVLGHRTTLVQVIRNLLSNAFKFTRPGERPRVRIRCERRDDALGCRIRFWVEDEGIGIARRHFDRIFGVFERLHGEARFAGTGVGLAIVKKGVERMGGSVGVESEEGRGSRFWVELGGCDAP